MARSWLRAAGLVLGDDGPKQVLSNEEPEQVLGDDEPKQVLGNDEPKQVLGKHKQTGSPETKNYYEEHF